MSLSLGSGKRPAAEMNVTPLIDVLLVLLIIFMVLPQERGLIADIPQPDGKAAPPEAPVVLEITQSQNGTAHLAINHQNLEWEQLRNRLLEIYKSRSDRVLFVKGDADVDFENVAEAIDIAHSADIRRVGLIPSN
jgi:biopolymer transport protein ExbD